jgi:hypothetical protein
MAEKFSKSILRNLKKMLHRAPKKAPASSSKKSTAAKGSAREHGALPSSVSPDQGSALEAPEAKPDKKKPKNQPWYRHRQRW